MAFETFSQRGLKPLLFFLCFTVSFKSTYLLPGRWLNCAQAFTRSFALSGGVLVRSFQSESEWSRIKAG